MIQSTEGKFGERLRRERLALNWSQERLAEAIGTTAMTVRRWEHGVALPQIRFREQLCQLFQRSNEELFGPPINTNRQNKTSTQIFFWNVPRHNPFFIGRDDVLRTLVMDLCTQEKEARAITGLPGVGKTSLAIALAHHPQIQERFRDGVLWIGLGSTPQLAETMNHLGNLLGMTSPEAQLSTTIDSIAHFLHKCLKNSQILLIIDDVWKLSDAVMFQIGGSQCVHLLTTRSPLLAYSFAHKHVISLQPLSEAASLHLLQQLAPLVSQRYPRELQALVQPIDGLPLALTLLGHLLHVQSLHISPRRLAQTLQHLNQDIQMRFQVAKPLPVGNANPSFPVGTDLSLHMTIDLSVHQLSPAAQRALHALAVFAPKPHSFSEEAALAVCDTSAKIFDALVDSGLVELCQGERYQIHQTILDYARLRGHDPAVEDRLIAFIVPFVETHHREMNILDQDLHLITIAFELAFTRQRYPLLLRGIVALQPFIEQRRHYTLGETLVLWGQKAALALDDREGLARLCLWQGRMADLSGEATQAQKAYFTGLAIAQELHHQELITWFVVLAGGMLLDTEAGSQAEAYLTEGLSVIESMEDDAPRSLVFRYLGELADHHGELDKATDFYQCGLQIAFQTRNWQEASALLQNLGAQAIWRSEYNQARMWYAKGMSYARRGKDLERQSALLMNMGMLAWLQHNQEKAIELSMASLKLAREIHHKRRISSVLQNLGMMMRHQEQLTVAEEYLQESLELAQQIGHRWLICETLGEVGLLMLKQKQIARAKQIFTDMQQQAQAIQAPLLLGKALFGLAQIAEQEGHRSEAIDFAQDSLAIFAQHNNHILTQEIEAWYTALSEECLVRK